MARTNDAAWRIAGGADCPHHADRRTFLGNMATVELYRCLDCGGVLLRDVA